MLKRLWPPFMHQTRQISVKQPKVKLKVKMDEETHKMLEAEELKPRKHAGRMRSQLADLPSWLPGAVKKALEDSPLTAVLADGVKLSNFLRSRLSPVEASILQAKYSHIKAELAEKRTMDETAPASEDEDYKDHIKSLQILKRTTHGWAPVNYNKYASLVYLASRSAQDYAVLHKIFGEIAARDKELKPTTVLDFGSGVGTALWAISQLWENSVRECMCVDASTDMNDLSELIHRQADPPFKGVFYRQFIPLSDRKYDIVVVAYSLLELPNMQTRLEIIAKLWDKTRKYLVIVEQGTNAGFKVVNEARDCILHLKKAGDETDPDAAYVFSPCPHELQCPRYNARDDDTPCNFEVTFKPLPLRNRASPGVERFSYVVLKKGKRVDETKNWPRIVRPVLLRSHHSVCRLCTPHGKLDEIIVTPAKHGRWMYRCAKSSRWGDRLPFEVLDEENKEEEQRQGEPSD